MSDELSGQRPDMLRPATDTSLDRALAELMKAMDAGEIVREDEWLTRHPEFTVELRDFFAQRERVERLVGPLRRAAANALHVRCPHCHNPIELPDEAPLHDIDCPSCGSSFSLVGVRTQPPFPHGAKMLGHFELIERVGIGQFGSVWKARDTKLDRMVAVKIPRNGQLDETQTELFLRDARAAAQIKHANIVGVHEIGTQDDMIYIVSDFVQGASLREWSEVRRLTPRESAELCSKVALALHHAHESGVIHRDLKPGNIMMDLNGEPHIVDFGLAKREAGETTMTITGQILGTPAYMSPEQARGEGHTADRGADIYSLGVILFELLSGELPFRGDKQMLILQIINDDPPNPRKLNSNIPRDLQTICLKCLRKEPERRYESASSLAADLRRFLADEPIRARPIGKLETAIKWIHRKPAAAALIGVSSLALIVIIVGLIVSNGMISNAFHETRTAERQAKEALVESYLDRARTGRSSDQPGRVFTGIAVMTRAAALVSQLDLEPDKILELRNEAISLMALNGDVEVVHEWTQPAHNWKAAFDSGLRHYAIRLGDGTVSVRRIKDNQTLANLPVCLEDGPGTQLEFSPNGKLLAIRSNRGGSCQVCDWQRRELLFQVRAQSGKSFQFRPDGSQIAVFDAVDRIRFYSLPSGREETSLALPFEPNFPQSMAFHPNGEFMAFGHGTKVEIWDLELKRRSRSFSGPKETITCFAWSDDGELFAAGSRDFSVSVWEFDSGRKRHVLRTGARVSEVRFNHSADTLLTIDHFAIARMWNVASGRQLLTVPGRAQQFSHDDEHLAYYSGNKVGVWKFAHSKEFRLLFDPQSQASSWPRAVDFSADRRLMFSSGPKGVMVWEVATGRTLAHLPIGRTYSVFARSGVSGFELITTGQQVLIWPLRDEESGANVILGPPRVFRKLQTHSKLLGNGSQYGRYLSVVSGAGTALALDLMRPQHAVTLKDGRSRMLFAVNSPDGRWLVTTAKQQAGVILWDARSGKRIKDLWPSVAAGSAKFSPTGEWLLVSGMSAYRLWHVASWRTHWTIPKEGRIGTEEPTAFSSDGQYLAVTVTGHGLQIVATATGRELATLDAPNQTLWGAAFSDDNRFLVSFGQGFVGLWNLPRVRRRLAALGLDWDRGPSVAGLDRNNPKSVRVSVDLGSMTNSDKSKWQLRPSMLGLYARRGESHRKDRDYRQAIANWEKVLKIDPRDSRTLYRLAWALLIGPEHVRDPQRALVLSKRVDALSPNSPWHWTNIGAAQYRLGQPRKAIKSLERAELFGKDRKDFHWGNTWLFLALSHQQASNPTTAREYYRKAVDWRKQKDGLGPPWSNELRTLQAEVEKELAVDRSANQ